MLVIGKWTHSIGCVVLIGSGMLRLPLPGFILVNLLATVPKSAVLFGFGYFAGDDYPLHRTARRPGLWPCCVRQALAAIALILRRADRVGAGR